VVSVTIFEAEPGGLFVPSDAGARPGNFVTLPDEVVDTNGTITVPYAGKIRAVGRTPAEVQDAISEALRAHVDRRSTQLVAAPPSTRKRRPAIEAFKILLSKLGEYRYTYHFSGGANGENTKSCLNVGRGTSKAPR
jgi:polysaccharide biosynthesis/export protein